MRAALAATAAAALIAGCGDSGGSGPEPPFEQTGPGPIGFEVPPGLERGQQAAEEQGCQQCHRFGERGAVAPGSDLTDIGDRFAPEAIRNFVVQGSESMPAYDELPPADLRALVAFLAALKQPR